MSEQSERITMNTPNGEFELKLRKLDSLKVYKHFRDFQMYAYLTIDKMPHWVKNSEGKECISSIKNCIDCLSVLARSHDAALKIEATNAFLGQWDRIYNSADFFVDTRVHGLSARQLAHWVLLMNEVEGQILRLRRYLECGVEADGVQKD